MATLTSVECSKCGREVPLDPAELAGWRHGELALEDDVGEGLLLCPDCDARGPRAPVRGGRGRLSDAASWL